LGAQWPCQARASDGQQVVYGIRPDHLALAREGIAAEVQVVEPMGAETEILLKVGAQTFTIMTHGRASLGPGEKVFLAPQAAQAHLFDASSGRRI
jgi:multiple sugar transport system ATP-binding protein